MSSSTLSLLDPNARLKLTTSEMDWAVQGSVTPPLRGSPPDSFVSNVGKFTVLARVPQNVVCIENASLTLSPDGSLICVWGWEDGKVIPRAVLCAKQQCCQVLSILAKAAKKGKALYSGDIVPSSNSGERTEKCWPSVLFLDDSW